MRPALLILLVALALPLLAAPPLTLEEARSYVAQYPEAAAQDIATLDAIERATPEATMPAGALIVAGDLIGWSWAGPLEIRIADRLVYTLELPRASARAPRPPWWPYAVAAGGGLLAGILAGAWAVSH